MDDLRQLLRSAAERLRTPEDLDRAVLAAAKARPRRSGFPFIATAAAAAASVLAALILPRLAAESECRSTLNALTRAVESRDIPRAVSLCFDEPETKARLAERLDRFYEHYPSVRYELRNIRIRLRGPSALATTTYHLVASGRNGEIRLSGTDRLYMERGPDGRFRIHHWIDS